MEEVKCNRIRLESLPAKASLAKKKAVEADMTAASATKCRASRARRPRTATHRNQEEAEQIMAKSVRAW